MAAFEQLTGADKDWRFRQEHDFAQWCVPLHGHGGGPAVTAPHSAPLHDCRGASLKGPVSAPHSAPLHVGARHYGWQSITPVEHGSTASAMSSTQSAYYVN